MNSERQERIKAKAAIVRRTFNGIVDRDDLEAARGIASAAIDDYGDFQETDTWDRYRADGIWNDHVAVQAALVAIKMMRAELVPLLSPTRSDHSLAVVDIARAKKEEGYTVMAVGGAARHEPETIAMEPEIESGERH